MYSVYSMAPLSSFISILTSDWLSQRDAFVRIWDVVWGNLVVSGSLRLDLTGRRNLPGNFLIWPTGHKIHTGDLITAVIDVLPKRKIGSPELIWLFSMISQVLGRLKSLVRQKCDTLQDWLTGRRTAACRRRRRSRSPWRRRSWRSSPCSRVVNEWAVFGHSNMPPSSTCSYEYLNHSLTSLPCSRCRRRARRSTASSPAAACSRRCRKWSISGKRKDLSGSVTVYRVVRMVASRTRFCLH